MKYKCHKKRICWSKNMLGGARTSLPPPPATAIRHTAVCIYFFSHSFTASDGSGESTAGDVVSPCSFKMHHGFRSNDVWRARKQKYRLCQTTSHSSLLVARQGDASRKLNRAFLLVDTFNFNFVDEERSDMFSSLKY